MNIVFQISQLWHYLNIKDDEILIIPVYNPAIDADEYLVAEKKNKRIEFSKVDKMPELSLNKPFKLIQHLGEDGKHIIPSVDQMLKDSKIDY